MKTVWTGPLPPDSKIFDLIPVPKTINADLFSKYRGFQNGDKLYQIKSKIAAERLSDYNKTVLDEAQAGFRPWRGCRDQRFCLQVILDEAAERRRPVYLAFVDIAKAFDS